MAGYLGKDDKFVKARFSQNWAFPYWWDFGRFCKRAIGIYVPDDELVRLSLITFDERRETNFWFDIFVDVRKYGWEGVFKMQNEKWKEKIGRKHSERTGRLRLVGKPGERLALEGD